MSITLIDEQKIIRSFAETILHERGNLSKQLVTALVKAAAAKYAETWVPEENEAKFVAYIVEDL